MEARNDAPDIAEFRITGGLCKLYFNGIMRDPVLIHYALHGIREIQIHYVLAREVDRHRNELSVLTAVKPGTLVLTDMLKHIHIKLADIVRLLKRRDEFDRRNSLAFADPSAKGLASDDPSCGDIDLRLIIRNELVVVKSIQEQLLYTHLLLSALQQRFIEEYDLILASALSDDECHGKFLHEVTRIIRFKFRPYHEHSRGALDLN